MASKKQTKIIEEEETTIDFPSTSINDNLLESEVSVDKEKEEMNLPPLKRDSLDITPSNSKPDVQIIGHGPPRGMSSVGHTIQFPRKDNMFRHKESLPYDEFQSILWKDREVSVREEIKEWMGNLCVGFLVGTIGFLMKIAEEQLI
jgi:hypothetical protein